MNNTNKRLVVITCLIFLMSSPLISFFSLPFFSKSDPVQIRTWGQINFGKEDSNIQIVVFEDLNCPYCKKYFLEEFPKIKEAYIDTEIASYTDITLTFLKSRDIAAAAHYVYEVDKEKYFPFLHEYFSTSAFQHGTKANIKITAENIGMKDFNPGKGVEMKDVLFFDNNLEIARKSMPGTNVTVPKIFVNGERLKDATFKAVKKAVEKNLNK